MTLNISNFTFVGEQFTAIKEAVRLRLVESPELNEYHTLFSSINVNKFIGILGNHGMVGKKDTGCNPAAQAFAIGVTQKEWKPTSWFVRVEECYKDLAATCVRYEMRNGVKIADFTETDYMAIVVEELVNAIKEFVLRVAYFGDTEASVYDAEDNATGTLKAGTDKGYFDLLDGFFKQIDTDLETVKVTAQHATAANVRDALSKVYYAAPVALRQRKDLQFLVSQHDYDLYEQSLKGVELEIMYRNMTDGIKSLTFNGIPVIPMPHWDAIADTCMQNADKYKKRIILTAKANLCIGVDDPSSIDTIETNYLPKDRTILVDAGGQLDAKVLDCAMVVTA